MSKEMIMEIYRNHVDADIHSLFCIESTTRLGDLAIEVWNLSVGESYTYNICSIIDIYFRGLLFSSL